MSDRIAFTVTVKLICTLFIAALASCDGGGGSTGVDDALNPKKSLITISGSVSDSLKSTVDVGDSANNQLNSINLSSLELASGVVVVGDITKDDLTGTLKVLAVDLNNNIYSTKTKKPDAEGNKKFALEVPSDKSYVIFFVNQNKKQIGVLVHDATQDEATSYKVKSDTQLGEIKITPKGKAEPSESKVRKELKKDIDTERKDVPQKISEVAINTPDELKAVVDEGVVELSWNAVSGVDGYKVYYDTTDDVSPDNFLITKDITSDLSVIKASSAIKARIEGLTVGETYYFIVTAYIDDNHSKPSNSAGPAVPVLASPIIINPLSKDTVIALSWGEVTGAASYKVYYSPNKFESISAKEVKIVDSPSNSAIITGLTSKTTYYMGVVAIAKNPAGNSQLSQLVKATTKPPPISKPAAPTNLQATGKNRAIDLTWGAVKDATSYKVYYHTASFKKTSDSGVQSQIVIAATNTSITGLLNGTKYFIRLVASNSKGDSGLSDEASAITKLPAPVKLQATGKNKAIDLSWNAVTGADGYKVYYSKASFSSTTDGGVQVKTGITATKASFGELTNGTTLYFRVAASNSIVDSKLSIESNATANLQAPTGLIAIGGQSVIDITWNAVFGATEYKVYFHTVSFDKTSDSGDRDPVDATTDSARIQDVKGGTKYYLRVEVINADGETKLSKIVTVTTKPDRPRDLVATGKYKAIDLSWDAVFGATSYTVYYHTASFDSTTVSVAKSTTGITAANTSITDLASGATYYFRVIASNASGSSALSQIQSATTKLLTLQPSATASINSPAAIDLTWNAVAGVTNYKIYYAKVSLDGLNGGYKNYASVGGKVETTTDTSITIGDLSADTTYYFVVAANYNGQEKAAPEITASSSYIAELAMGGRYGCVRLNTGGIKCWGGNESGQLGVGDTSDRYTATSVPGMRAKQLSAGAFHSCVIEDLSYKLYCWGNNGDSQLGLSGSHSISSPTLVTQANFAKVSLVTAGYSSTCALAGGENYCWGSQKYGALGNGVDKDDSTMDAQRINDITPDVQQFALGYNSGCAKDASNDLWCWGYNEYGQVGDRTDGKNANRPSPVKPLLQGGSTATMVDGKDEHYCVVDDAKKIQCWGWNRYGQLGIGSITDSNSPQYVLASSKTKPKSKPVHLTGVSKIATGDWHSCALIKGGKVRCWGKSVYGIIGTDATTDRLVADTDMKGISNAIDIAAGYYHTCVLLADKARVKCWGKNSNGQLGNGIISSSHTPVAVQGL